MEIKELDREAVGQLYEVCLRRDFPPAELRPLASIRYLEERGLYRTLGCYVGGELGAYATFVTAKGEPAALLLDYYAVDPRRRGQGLGSRFLAELGQALKGLAPYLLLEAESLQSAQTPAQEEERTRRFSFYRGCGCIETGVYSQVFGVEYRILALPLGGQAPTDEDVLAAMMSLYRTFVPPIVGPGQAAFHKVCRCFLR